MIFLIFCAAVVWVLFVSKSIAIGKALYELNNWVESKLAGLSKHSLVESAKDKSGGIHKTHFSYLSNHNSGKPVLIMLHGFSADKYIWLKFAKYCKDYHVIIPDFMGHGDNEYIRSEHYSAFEQAKYIVKFINALGLQGNIRLIGNSMGGMVAGILAENTNIQDEQSSEYSLLKSTISHAILLDPAGAKTEFSSDMEGARK